MVEWRPPGTSTVDELEHKVLSADAGEEVLNILYVVWSVIYLYDGSSACLFSCLVVNFRNGDKVDNTIRTFVQGLRLPSFLKSMLSVVLRTVMVGNKE